MNISGPVSSIPNSSPTPIQGTGGQGVSSGGSAQMGGSTVTLSQTAAMNAVKGLAMLQRDMGDQIIQDSADVLRRTKDNNDLKDVDSQFTLNSISTEKLRVPCHFVLDLNLAKQDQIRKLLKMVSSDLKWVKLSNAFIAKHGPEMIDEISSMGFRVFVDLRLSTAQKTSLSTLESLEGKSIQLLSIHLEGNKDNIRQFLAKKQEVLPYTQLIVRSGVGHTRRFTANNTSLEESMSAYLDRLLAMLNAFNLKGMMCSTKDIPYFRQSFGPKIDLMIQEGIALKEGVLGKLTPAQAAASGASYIIIAASEVFRGGNLQLLCATSKTKLKGWRKEGLSLKGWFVSFPLRGN